MFLKWKLRFKADVIYYFNFINQKFEIWRHCEPQKISQLLQPTYFIFQNEIPGSNPATLSGFPVFSKAKTATLFLTATAALMTTMVSPLAELLKTVSKESKLETPGAKTRLRNLFRYISVKWNLLPRLDMAVNTQENG